MQISINKVKNEIVIITPYKYYFGGVEYINKMLIETLESQGINISIISQESIEKQYLFKFRKRLFGLNRLLAWHFKKYYAQKANIVICNGEYGLGVQHEAAINIFHGCYYGYAKAMRSCISQREYNKLMRLADQQKRGAIGKLVVAVSKSIKDLLMQQGVKVDTVIRNPVDAKRFKPALEVKKNGRSLFVGSSDYYGKGIDILEKIVNLGFEIDCITSKRLKSNRLGYLGNIDNEKLPHYYKCYSYVILPSRFEGSSLVLLEAMACGTPIITTNVGSGKDIAKEIPEFVVSGPWENIPREIAARIRIINDGYDKYAVAARKYVVRNHGLTEWKKNWLDTINNLRYFCKRKGG